jgi:IS5 family transposase
MAHKETRQGSLGDSLLIEHKALRTLGDIHALIDWSRLDALMDGIHASEVGNLAYPPLMKFKALLLLFKHGISSPTRN